MIISINISEIEDIAGTEFDKLLLQQMHLGELDIVDLRINQQLDMSEELLGVVSVPMDYALSMSSMPWDGSRIGFHE